MAVIVDEAELRIGLVRTLEGAGYCVAAAPDGDSGLRAVLERQPQLVLLDLRRSSDDTLAVVAQLRARRASADVPLIALAFRRSERDLGALLDAGVSDFVSRPVSRNELLVRVESALTRYELSLRRDEAHSIVASLANAVEAKDPSIDGHCRRLAYHAARLAASVGLRGDELEAVAFGAILHDIGKIAISERLLNKSGRLDSHELERMREHPEIGGRICEPLTTARRFATIIRHHHERWDGAGYPHGLAGEQIPLGARIVAIADAYDAMTFGRPYRRPRTHEQAIEELYRCAGTQFDPALVPQFVAESERTAAGIAPVVELPLAHLVAPHIPVTRVAVGPGIATPAGLRIARRPARAA